MSVPCAERGYIQKRFCRKWFLDSYKEGRDSCGRGWTYFRLREKHNVIRRETEVVTWRRERKGMRRRRSRGKSSTRQTLGRVLNNPETKSPPLNSTQRRPAGA